MKTIIDTICFPITQEIMLECLARVTVLLQADEKAVEITQQFADMVTEDAMCWLRIDMSSADKLLASHIVDGNLLVVRITQDRGGSIFANLIEPEPLRCGRCGEKTGLPYGGDKNYVHYCFSAHED